MQTCEHMLEREILHEPSGISGHDSQVITHTPGDRIVLSCPHGCSDIVITVVSDDENEEMGGC